jgi:hypothetical protein
MHARFAERTTKDGERIFFLDELQSDLHQKAGGNYRESDVQMLHRIDRYLGDTDVLSHDPVRGDGINTNWNVTFYEKEGGRVASRRAAVQPDDIGEIKMSSLGSPYKVGEKKEFFQEDLPVLYVDSSSPHFDTFLAQTGQQKRVVREKRVQELSDDRPPPDPSQMSFQEFEVDWPAIQAEDRAAIAEQAKDYVRWRLKKAREDVKARLHGEGRTPHGGAYDIDRINEGKVNAPLQKSWVELGLKRLIRWAAENGFDRFAWTHAREQAVRYGRIYFDSTSHGSGVLVSFDLMDGEFKIEDADGRTLVDVGLDPEGDIGEFEEHLSYEMAVALRDRIDEAREDIMGDYYAEEWADWDVRFEAYDPQSGETEYFDNM